MVSVGFHFIVIPNSIFALWKDHYRHRYVELLSNKLIMQNAHAYPQMRNFYTERCLLSPIKSCDKFPNKKRDQDSGMAGSIPELKLIENLWTEMKDKVAEKQPSYKRTYKALNFVKKLN